MPFKPSTQYFRFCPHCGARFLIKKTHGLALLTCPHCSFVFYQNSKPTATALIVDTKGRLLFVKRAIRPKKGWWDFPGGFLEEGEDPLIGLTREIREELGCRLNDIQYLGIYMDIYGHRYREYTLNIIYTARIASGIIKAQDDVSATRWFSKNNIPWSRLAFPKWMRPAIRDWSKRT